MLGFHASHESFPPDVLLQAVRLADAAGFQGAMCSDHFHPWTAAPFAQSAFAWTWLGAALQATRLPFGVVNAPGQRYHPAVIAQAAATLAVMYPQRFWLALGTGEALNESITGEPWPSKEDRKARLLESVRIIRAVWRGDTVTHSGAVQIAGARLATRPETPPRLVGAAITEPTAEWVGAWADGLITVGIDARTLRSNVEAFRRGGGRGKPLKLQLGFAYAASEDAALQLARDRWAHAALDPTQLADLPTPEAFDRATAHLTAEDLRGHLRVTHDLARVRGWIEESLALGFDEIYLSPIVEDLLAFVSEVGDRVVPQLRAAA
jgi:coenzyme F420-dependent glucose-6-phosphate dehydrogenase